MAKSAITALYCAAAFIFLFASKAAAADYYRLLRADRRRCASPYCGGYYLEKLNVAGSAIYVGGIDYSKVNASVKATVDNATSTLGGGSRLSTTIAQGLVILYGDLVPYQRPVLIFRINKLQVLSAYIGLPGQNITEGATTYATLTSVGNLTTVRKLNDASGVSYPIDRWSVTAVQPVGFLDVSWQLNQLLYQGAIVLGTFTMRGASARIAPKAVFAKIPVLKGNCPLYKIACDAAKGGVVVWTRSANLCFRPGCTYNITFCTLSLPVCPLGYRLAAWPAPPGGCPTYRCDPIFAPVATITSFD